MNKEWVVEQLDRFLTMTSLQEQVVVEGTKYVYPTRGDDDEIVRFVQVIERIFASVMPDWREVVPSARNELNRWQQHREAAARCRAIVLVQEEVDEMLGDTAPRLSASHLHAWVWDAAGPSWSAGFHRHAVGDALLRVNRETQRKVGRTDVSETKLFQEAFSDKPPEDRKPRLRLHDDPESSTFLSIHRGARSLAEGLYAAVRNPLAHEESALAQDEALELLAAISILARWVDRATVSLAQ